MSEPTVTVIFEPGGSTSVASVHQSETTPAHLQAAAHVLTGRGNVFQHAFDNKDPQLDTLEPGEGLEDLSGSGDRVIFHVEYDERGFARVRERVGAVPTATHFWMAAMVCDEMSRDAVRRTLDESRTARKKILGVAP